MAHIRFQDGIKNTKQNQLLEKFREHLGCSVAGVSPGAAKEKCPTQAVPKEVPTPGLLSWNWPPLGMLRPSQATRQPGGRGRHGYGGGG